jgi:hypothetical protein
VSKARQRYPWLTKGAVVRLRRLTPGQVLTGNQPTLEATAVPSDALGMAVAVRGYRLDVWNPVERWACANLPARELDPVAAVRGGPVTLKILLHRRGGLEQARRYRLPRVRDGKPTSDERTGARLVAFGRWYQELLSGRPAVEVEEESGPLAAAYLGSLGAAARAGSAGLTTSHEGGGGFIVPAPPSSDDPAYPSPAPPAAPAPRSNAEQAAFGLAHGATCALRHAVAVGLAPVQSARVVHDGRSLPRGARGYSWRISCVTDYINRQVCFAGAAPSPEQAWAEALAVADREGLVAGPGAYDPDAELELC